MSEDKMFPEFDNKTHVLKKDALYSLHELMPPMTIENWRKEWQREGASKMLALIVHMYKEQGIMLCGDNNAIWEAFEKEDSK